MQTHIILPMLDMTRAAQYIEFVMCDIFTILLQTFYILKLMGDCCLTKDHQRQLCDYGAHLKSLILSFCFFFVVFQISALII